MATPLRRLLLAAVVTIPALLVADWSAAQSRTSIGLGFNTVLSTKQGLGVGFRFRGARALNEDLSIAAGVGLTGFVLGGQDDASYLIDPQLSLIVTLGGDQPGRATYALGGFGIHYPTGSENEEARGPMLHAGMGWVRGLYSTRLFYELDPALIIGERKVQVAFPFRIGVIF